MSVVKLGEIIRHILRELSQTMWHFLSRGGQLFCCEVTGKRKRRKGLEMPCIYHLIKGCGRRLESMRLTVNYTLNNEVRLTTSVYSIWTMICEEWEELICARFDLGEEVQNFSFIPSFIITPIGRNN